jgi:hypothetical protein
MQNVVDFFDSHSDYQRIASYYGVSGLGFQASSGSNTSGENCWAVWKMINGTEPWFLWIGSTFDSVGFPTTTNPSGSHRYNCSTAPNEAGLGVILAWHSSSNAWNGSSNNNGRDSFATSSMWKSGSVILPHVNSPWGACSSSRDCAVNIFSSNFFTTGYGTITADSNYIMMFLSSSTIAQVNGMTFTRFTPATASFDLPYVLFGGADTDFFPEYDTIYTRNSEILRSKGGISLRKPQSSGSVNYFSASFGMVFSSLPTTYRQYGIGKNAGLNPNTTKEFYEFPICLYLSDFDANYVGYFASGTISTVNGTVATPIYSPGDQFNSGSRIVLAGATQPLVFPWSSSFGFMSQSFGTFYTSQSVFLTNFGYLPITSSNLKDTVGGTTEVTVYRGAIGGTFYYGNTNPPVPGATNVVIIKRYQA